MVLKWVIVCTGMILFQQLAVISSVASGMECHYCGIRGICTLPYVAEKSGTVEKINCTHSCMKFDGKDGNGKRVVVRSCGKKNLTNCKLNENWNGAFGELCYCNKQLCNAASKNGRSSFMSLFILFITIFSAK